MAGPVPGDAQLDTVAEQVRCGDPARARGALDVLLSDRPDDAGLRSLDAELLLRERRPRRALAAIEAAIGAGGATADRLTCAGRCLNNLGRLADAETHGQGTANGAEPSASS